MQLIDLTLLVGQLTNADRLAGDGETLGWKMLARPSKRRLSTNVALNAAAALLAELPTVGRAGAGAASGLDMADRIEAAEAEGLVLVDRVEAINAQLIVQAIRPGRSPTTVSAPPKASSS